MTDFVVIPRDLASKLTSSPEYPLVDLFNLFSTENCKLTTNGKAYLRSTLIKALQAHPELGPDRWEIIGLHGPPVEELNGPLVDDHAGLPSNCL
jgi:hypothetical protein